MADPTDEIPKMAERLLSAKGANETGTLGFKLAQAILALPVGDAGPGVSAVSGKQEKTAQDEKDGRNTTDPEFTFAISQVPLCISSTRRGGENGLRNADEVYQALKTAGFRLVKA